MPLTAQILQSVFFLLRCFIHHFHFQILTCKHHEYTNVFFSEVCFFFRSFFFSEKFFFHMFDYMNILKYWGLAMWLIFFFSVLSTKWVHGVWHVYLTLFSISLLEAIPHWYILFNNRDYSLVIILGVWCERIKRNYLNNF